jgi:hypothetical protein
VVKIAHAHRYNESACGTTSVAGTTLIRTEKEIQNAP